MKARETARVPNGRAAIAAFVLPLLFCVPATAQRQFQQFGGYGQRYGYPERFANDQRGPEVPAPLKPDTITTTPQVDAEGIRHFSNGRHFDLNKITATNALAQARMDNPRFNQDVPNRKRRNRNRRFRGGAFGGNDNFADPYGNDWQPQQMRRQPFQPGVRNYDPNSLPPY